MGVLEPVGLTEQDERLYFELLLRPGRTRAELASALLDWPPSRTARTLKTLINAGLVTTLSGKPPRYSPIAPDVALEGLSLRHIDRVREVQRKIPELMERFWKAQREGVAGDLVEILTGDPVAVRTRVTQLQSAARIRVRALARRPYAANPNVPTHVELDALEHGVRYQVVYEQDEVCSAERWPDLLAGIAAGEEARVFASLPVKLTLFDDWAGTTPLVDEAGHWIGTIVVHRSPYWTRCRRCSWPTGPGPSRWRGTPERAPPRSRESGNLCRRTWSSCWPLG
ncbi:TrmB family transcriptional regulator [Nonomuraea thailandensis]